MSRYAAACSTHPVVTEAVGEVAGTLLEALDGEQPDLLVVFVSPHFLGAAEDVGRTLRTLLEPTVLVGSATAAVIGGARELERAPAISAWAATLPGSEARAIRLRARASSDGWELEGALPNADRDGTLVLLPDPLSFPVEAALDAWRRERPGLTVVGGAASAAAGPGGNRLLLDGRVVADGAVGVLLDRSVPVRALVSQGCRPVGRPFVVTEGSGNVVRELGGRPALERLEDLASASSDAERSLLARGLHVGIVVDEGAEEPRRGDFLVRNVRGAIRDEGAVVLDAEVEIGRTLQFQVRDALSADEDLTALLTGCRAGGALLFACTGRGSAMFGADDHDAATVERMLGPIPVAGAFCAGELAPVGGENHLHGQSLALALFDD